MKRLANVCNPGQSHHIGVCYAHRLICRWVVSLCAVQDIKFNVHAHPTLSEVLDELFKQAHVDAPGSNSKPVAAKAPAKQPVAA